MRRLQLASKTKSPYAGERFSSPAQSLSAKKTALHVAVLFPAGVLAAAFKSRCLSYQDSQGKRPRFLCGACGLPDLGRLYIRSFHTLSALGGFILNRLAVPKGLEAIHSDVRMMNEQVVTTAIGCNKAKTFLVTKPLHSTFIHLLQLPGPMFRDR